MKILLVGNYLPDAQESMQRFTHMLEEGLREKGYEVVVIRPQVYLGGIQWVVPNARKWLGYIDKYILFDSSLKEQVKLADLIHVIDHSNAIYNGYFRSKPSLLTCNDLLAIRSAFNEFPENKIGLTGRLLQHWILQGINQSQWVACISENTQRDLLRISQLPLEKTCVIHMGLNYNYQVIVEAKKLLSQVVDTNNCPFVLHVGGNQWYKNRMGVLSIFYRLTQQYPDLPIKLVMVGKPFTLSMNQYIFDKQIQSRVVSLVSINNQQLEILYNCTEALLFPSRMEGFGWPIIEAQACGCPVVCSSQEPLPEVAGDAALMASVEDEQALAQHLYTVLTKPELRQDLIRKGLQNVLRFRSEDMINSYINLYQKVVEKFYDSPLAL
ncbi:MAG: glycosyltransferase family 1 protein [Cyanobacteriota bacterium]|nr:glycosyltransferase family 1 protein [Cyanobacteriota bacterium]